MQKLCRHQNMSECFINAKKNGKFSDDCIAEIRILVLKYFFSRVENEAEAEDLTQEICIIISNCFINYNPYYKAENYVLAIARNILLKHLIKKNKVNMASYENSNLEISLNEDNIKLYNIKEAINYCLNKLPSSEKHVIILKIKELSINEIEIKTSLSERQIGYRIRKAFESLKKCLRKQGYEGD